MNGMAGRCAPELPSTKQPNGNFDGRPHSPFFELTNFIVPAIKYVVHCQIGIIQQQQATTKLVISIESASSSVAPI